MSAEIRYTSPWPVLDARGRPNPGWADEGLFHYDRRAIKAAPWRIKEWDFYQVSDAEFCLQFTFGHAAYAGNVGCMLFDFKNGVRWAVSAACTCPPLQIRTAALPTGPRASR